MDQIAFLFPGQGSQRVGMGLDLMRRWPKLTEAYYRRADELLGFELSRLCWQGPAQELRQMPVTQPAVVLTSVVALEVLRAHGLMPDIAAGHSLGEFSALVCAGVLDWTDALRLVRLRGELMMSANERVPGKMAAVVGLDLATVEEMCAKAAAASGEVVEVANHNDFTQVVISGQTGGVDALAELVWQAGADRVVMLEIGGAAHCTLLGGIEDEFAAALEEVEFRDPVIPVISSFSAAPVADGADARACLRRQLTGRVNWTGTALRLAAEGAGRLVEVGPGKVLGGLCRRITPGVVAHRTDDAGQLSLTLAALADRGT
ncbi:ACP S-malonyltransferase [Streptomyces silvisoli]|uniref:Malonyl CoA-acyl carrier protein transacylase n=1 Tax=Streptomyces silvisoli TaxID=3034235 RepID=A0ABT5ZU63_9ACTN|nr:ACP S-malonyltransferase [Streptomyces silvisoli]MDF3293370.1 ACP S-malonyltransferase [Streptomyces silvisoli]